MKVNNNKMPCRDNLLKLHYRISFSRGEIVSVLPHKHSVVIGIRSLKASCWKQHLCQKDGCIHGNSTSRKSSNAGTSMVTPVCVTRHNKTIYQNVELKWVPLLIKMYFKIDIYILSFFSQFIKKEKKIPLLIFFWCLAPILFSSFVLFCFVWFCFPHRRQLGQYIISAHQTGRWHRGNN